MSKTKGNWVSWKTAVEKVGPDAYRLASCLTADGMDDADWRMAGAEDAKARVDSIIPFVKKSLKGSVARNKDSMDAWLLSSMNRRIKAATEAMQEMRMRRGAATVFIDTWNDIRRYMHRVNRPRKQTLVDVFNAWVRMMTPFTPFVAEELNHELGGKGLVSQADWPSQKDFPLDESAELAEIFVDRVIEDARNVLKVVKGPRTKLNVYTPSRGAREYFVALANTKGKKEGVGAIVKKYSSLKIGPDRVFKLLYEVGDDLLAKYLSQPRFDEYKTLAEASKFMGDELGIPLVVQKAESPDVKDPGKKAKDALPMKPAFFIE
jgi:leucyl-tRNA synthetase